MNTITTAVYDVMESLITDILKTIDGIPDSDLSTWKPAAEEQGGGPMNTFAAIAVHTASAGRWMISHQVFSEDFTRDRDAEFAATASGDEIKALYRDWLADLKLRVESRSAVDLAQQPQTISQNHAGWTRAHFLFHAIDHTGLHLGHLQIHRQLWDAACLNRNSDESSIH